MMDINIILKADSGNYLARCNNCIPNASYPDSAFVHVKEAEVRNSPWAQFTIKRLDNGKYTLKADSGNYLARCNSCIPRTSYNYPDSAFVHVKEADVRNSPWAQWEIIMLPSGITWKQEEIPLKPAAPTTGEFQIPTTSINGVEFTNKLTKDSSYKFTPSGTWKPKSDIPDCTAAGVKGFAPELQAPYLEALKPYQQYLKYQNNTYFALVAVNKTTGVVTEVGQETTIVLKPGETLTFVVNDLTVNYADNTGTLTVKWAAS